MWWRLVVLVVVLLGVFIVVGCSIQKLLPDLRFNSMSLLDACTFAKDIVYVDEEFEHFQHPIYTLDNMSGDCEDIAGVIMYLSGRGRFAVIKLKDGQIHAVVKYAGQYFDQRGLLFGSHVEEELNIYSYEEYLMMCKGLRKIEL